MRKFIFAVLLLIVLTPAYATEYRFDTSKINEIFSEYDNEFFDSHDYSKMISDIQQGNFQFDYSKMFQKAWRLLIQELRQNLGIAVQIVMIALLTGLLEHLKGNFASEGVMQIAFYVTYAILATLIVGSFLQIYDIAKELIANVTNFMKILLPILVGLITASGGINVSSIVYPLILVMSQFVTYFMTSFLLPISMIAFVLSLVSGISSKVKVAKIPKMLKSFSMWSMGIMLTIFVGLVSLEGTIGSSIDGITSKTAKFLFSGGIPVVGKLLGDSIDTILGSTILIKDAIGFIGIMALFGAVLTPIVKILSLLLVFYITSAIIEPFSDKRICQCLSDTAENGKIVLGVVITVCIMFMIATVAMMKMSNTAVMYR
ncbi:MAG: stage III sporulation protein AE [Clostridia bacterium]|nr:stage III sporulation protein AE [Clostridia bacterium]